MSNPPGSETRSRQETVILDREGVSLMRDGGARRDRTDDLMLAKHALYQLSYGPSRSPHRASLVGRSRIPRDVVGPGRFELPTSRLSGVRSNQLSYGPMAAHRPRLAQAGASKLALGLAIAPRDLNGRR